MSDWRWKRGRAVSLALGLLLRAAAGIPRARPALAQSVTIQDLFSDPAILAVELNPSGTHVAARVAHSDANGLLVQELETGVIKPVLRNDDPLILAWVDDDTLVLTTFSQSNVDTFLGELDQQEYWLDFEVHAVEAEWGPAYSGLLASTNDQLTWSTSENNRAVAYRLPPRNCSTPKGATAFPTRSIRWRKSLDQ